MWVGRLSFQYLKGFWFYECNPLVPPKALACDDRMNKIPEAFSLAGHFLADLVDARTVAAVQLATDGVGDQFLGEGLGKHVLTIKQQLLEKPTFSQYRSLPKGRPTVGMGIRPP